MKTIEGQIYNEMGIREREGKREEETKILLACWTAGRGYTKESTQGRAKNLRDFKL